MASGGDATPRRAPTTKVKVVASRYAQAIQKTNLEARASSSRASVKVGSGRATTARAITQTRTGVVVAAPSTPAVATPGSDAMSITERLRLYRANKAAQRPGSAGSKASRPPASAGATESLRSAPRPALPERITPPTEKAPPRAPSRVGSATTTPVKRRVATPSTRATPATVTSQTPKPRPTPSGSLSATGGTATMTSAARVPTSTTEEELELLECMYLQLCLAEASAADTFHRQEQSAERQMVAAWNILQSKLQLLHDTSIRLDRELHIRTVEEHLDNQAEALIRLGSVIASFGDDLGHVTDALGASLQRMPTPGVVCSPLELKRQLESLSSTLEAFQNVLQSGGMGSTVADALAFTHGMEESTEQISCLLLQVGHLLEDIQLEVNTETSLKAHSIQEARVQQRLEAKEWW